jgi:hypothetical protein
MILSVSRFAIDEPEATRAVEKAWRAIKKRITWMFADKQLPRTSRLPPRNTFTPLSTKVDPQHRAVYDF